MSSSHSITADSRRVLATRMVYIARSLLRIMDPNEERFDKRIRCARLLLSQRFAMEETSWLSHTFVLGVDLLAEDDVSRLKS